MKSIKFLEHLSRALGAAGAGKGENILSTAVVRFQSEEEQRSCWAGVVLHGGCSFVGFWTNSDEF